MYHLKYRAAKVLMQPIYRDTIQSHTSNIILLLQGSHSTGDTKFHVFSRLFPGKNNENPGQFGFE